MIRFFRAGKLQAALLLSFVLTVLFAITQGILYLFGLSFRYWVLYPFLAVLLCFLLSLTIWGLRRIHAKKGRMSALFSVVLACCWLAAGILGSLMLFMAHRDAHVTTRYGEKMLAEVSTFWLVDVWYYQYVNGWVRGKDVLIYEDYWELGYDPLLMDSGDFPIKVIDYRTDDKQP